MGKELYFTLDDGQGEGGTMKLSGCVEWIKEDMEVNYPGNEYTKEEDLPQYTLTPVWMTKKEYDELPEQ